MLLLTDHFNTRLPAELVDLVFDLLPSSIRVQTLKRCSLVCQSWRVHCQRLLFRTTHVHALNHPSPFAEFLTFFESTAHTHLGRHVRTLILSGSLSTLVYNLPTPHLTTVSTWDIYRCLRIFTCLLRLELNALLFSGDYLPPHTLPPHPSLSQIKLHLIQPAITRSNIFTVLNLREQWDSIELLECRWHPNVVHSEPFYPTPSLSINSVTLQWPTHPGLLANFSSLLPKMVNVTSLRICNLFRSELRHLEFLLLDCASSLLTLSIEIADEQESVSLLHCYSPTR